MKRSILLILLLFCVVLTGCQSGKDNAGRYYTVVTNAPAATQKAPLETSQTVTNTPAATQSALLEITQTEELVQVSADVSVQATTKAPTNHLSAVVRSYTGKTTVTFDADVPSGAECSWKTYLCQQRLFTEEEIIRMADACFGADQYSGGSGFTYEHHEIDKNNPYANDMWQMWPKSMVRVTGFGGQATASAEMPVDMIRRLPGGEIDAYAEYRMAQVPGRNYFGTLNIPYPLSAGVVDGITLEEAEQVAVEAVSAFAPEYSLVCRALTKGELLSEDAGDRRLQGSWGYFFVFAPCIDCRDINYAHSSFITISEIIVIVDKEGIQAMKFQDPHEIVKELEMVELLPFEQISEIAFELFPLKYASFEKDCVAVDLYVNKIQLGYMFVMSRNQPEYFELIPVWDFYGYEVYESRNGKNVYENAYTSLLTINAVDGTVIDRNYGY